MVNTDRHKPCKQVSLGPSIIVNNERGLEINKCENRCPLLTMCEHSILIRSPLLVKFCFHITPGRDRVANQSRQFRNP